MDFELMIEEAVSKAVAKALANQGKPAKAKKNSKKTKGSTPKRPRVVIEGHPAELGRSTWTQAMHDAAGIAYKALRDSGEGKYADWNDAGLEAAKKVA